MLASTTTQLIAEARGALGMPVDAAASPWCMLCRPSPATGLFGRAGQDYCGPRTPRRQTLVARRSDATRCEGRVCGRAGGRRAARRAQSQWQRWPHEEVLYRAGQSRAEQSSRAGSAGHGAGITRCPRTAKAAPPKAAALAAAGLITAAPRRRATTCTIAAARRRRAV